MKKTSRENIKTKQKIEQNGADQDRNNYYNSQF